MWQMAGKNNRILLWRHGQTDWNVVNRFQGHSDIDLNDVGVYQAELAAPIIAGMEPTAILSSDLSRARVTASKLSEIVNMEVLVDEVAARASAAIDEFLGDKENQLIVVATHGGTARCLIGHYLHLPMAHWGKIGGLSNARWSILQTSPKGWHLAEHNAGSILEPVFGEESGADVPDHVR